MKGNEIHLINSFSKYLLVLTTPGTMQGTGDVRVTLNALVQLSKMPLSIRGCEFRGQARLGWLRKVTQREGGEAKGEPHNRNTTGESTVAEKAGKDGQRVLRTSMVR